MNVFILFAKLLNNIVLLSVLNLILTDQSKIKHAINVKIKH